MIKKEALLKMISGLIAALFFYAAASKLVDYNKSRHEMLNQVFPVPVAEVLVWLIPVIEIGLMGMLLFVRTRKKGLWASLFLLSVFTLYIGIAMTGVFGRVPCSCGGILKNMPYRMHLIFNLFFVGLCFLGLMIANEWKISNKQLNLKKERNLPGTVDKT